MVEVNLLDCYPVSARTDERLKNRFNNQTEEDIKIARKFGKEYFDGDQKTGYGGYYYDGRWKSTAQRIIEYYKLESNVSILEIGCAKGFLLHELKTLLPNAHVSGIDISEYAISNATDLISPFLKVGSADNLPWDDNSFDLVITINAIHYLNKQNCIIALNEIERVKRKNAYIRVNAYRNENEYDAIKNWDFVAQTLLSPEEWLNLMNQANYTGDYSWFFFGE